MNNLSYPSPPMLERLRTTMSQIKNFDTLSIEAQEAIINAATFRHYDAGKVIYLEGEPAGFVYILEKGWVKATRMTHEGREQGLIFLRPVEIFGDIAAFTGVSYPGTTTALESVDCWAIPSQALLELVQEYPDLAMLIIRKLSQRILYYIGLVEDLSLRSVEARFAHTLLNHAEIKDGRLVVPRRYWTTFDEMAIRLGTVRDVLSRVIKSLEADGMLKVEKKEIILLDPKGLSERANR